MKFLPWKLNTRGRKREAKRWLYQAQVRNDARHTWAQDEWLREWEKLREADPVLHAAAMQVSDEEYRRNAKLTFEQWSEKAKRKYGAARPLLPQGPGGIRALRAALQRLSKPTATRTTPTARAR